MAADGVLLGDSGQEPHPNPKDMATAPLLSMLGSTPTNMAVRCQSKCVASVAVDMKSYGHWSDSLDRWMAHPGFDMAEFSRLCRQYKLD